MVCSDTWKLPGSLKASKAMAVMWGENDYLAGFTLKLIRMM